MTICLKGMLFLKIKPKAISKKHLFNGDRKGFLIIIINLILLLYFCEVFCYFLFLFFFLCFCFKFYMLKQTQEHRKYGLQKALRKVFKLYANQHCMFDSVLILKKTFQS